MSEPVNPVEVAAGPPVPSAVAPEEEFDPAYEAFNAWERNTLRPGMNALAASAYANTVLARAARVEAGGSADAAQAARDQAVIAAQSAVNAPGSMATSATSLTIGPGDKVFVLTEAGKDFAVGQFIVSSSIAAPTVNFMTGRVKAYDKPSKTLTMGGVIATGAGTFADWSIAVAVAPSSVLRVAYEDRANLRGMVPLEAALALVPGLGLFTFSAASTEPDDDETCFVTSNGCWLLEAVSYDLVDAYLQQAIEEVAPQWIYRTVANTLIASVASGQRLAWLVDMPGASVGDIVGIAQASDNVNVLTGNAAYFAEVRAADTVTVWFHGAGASWTPTGPWNITLLKKAP